MKIRECPICESKKYKIIFCQKFTNHFYHNIACCTNCGFVFVNNAPDQKYYDAYYKNMSKYEHERDNDLHTKYFRIIKKFCPKNKSVIDIGCATGHLLYLLKQAGFNKLFGIEPAPACKKIALKQFKLRIETSSLHAFKPRQKFDFIIFTAILEHLPKVKDAVEKISSLLNNNGYVFMTVPDAKSFHIDFEEPFGEFSTEHINFFSQSSLFQVMQNFKCQYIKSDKKAIYSVWKKDSDLENSINKYISLSQLKLDNLKKQINSLPKNVLVWGAGSLTQRLLKTSNLRSKVFKFIDSNRNLEGKKLAGVEIISPEKLNKYKQAIFISTFRFKDEIVDYIKKNNLTNKIFSIS